MKNFFLCFLVAIGSTFGQSSEDYSWENVPIGGGGYITGMKIHPLDASKRYFRADVGGAYRWDQNSQRMVQMVYSSNKNHYSVAGIALDPINTNLVYLAVGLNCNPNDQAILKSTDAGQSFQILNISGDTQFWFAANGGRVCDANATDNIPNHGDKDRQGSPIAINPLNTNELYIGTREKGLFILNLNTLVSTQVDPNQIPENTTQYSIRSIVFHPTSPIVFIAYSGHGLYKGNTNTLQFINLNQSSAPINNKLLNAIDISISKNADYLLVACKTSGLLKATNLTSTLSWSVPTGLPAIKDEGFLTVTCSPQDNNISLSVQGAWNQIDHFLISTNSGNSYTEINGSFDQNMNIFKWRTESFASHVSQIAFDPVQSSKLYFTSWFTTAQCNNFTSTGPLIWGNLESAGHEEIVPTDLVAFPSNNAGNFLVSGSGDHGGFIFDSSIENPSSFANTYIGKGLNLNGLKKSASFDFCENQPQNLVAALQEEWSTGNGGLLLSTNGGVNWSLMSGYPLANQKSIVAMSSDNPQNIVALGSNGLFYTKDQGFSFHPSGINFPANSDCNFPFNITAIGTTNVGSGSYNQSVFAAFRNVVADKNYSCVFYFYDWNGNFSISIDGGENWAVINSNQLPASTNPWDKSRLISIPQKPGHLWININNTLYHSTDAGQTWTNYSTLANLDKVGTLSFGKGLQNNYSSLYIYAKFNNSNEYNIYRSDDAGLNWVQISNQQENEVWGEVKFLAGDRNNAGKVYIGLSGLGVLMGEKQCLSSEKTIKGEFDDINQPNIPAWTTSQINGATMSAFTNNWTKAVLEVNTLGNNNYDLQLWQDNLSFESNKNYLIQVNARSDSDRNLTIKLRNRLNGNLVYLEKSIQVKSTAQEFAFLFNPSSSDTDARLSLLFGNENPTLYIDHIRFKELCDSNLAGLDCLEELYFGNLDLLENQYKAKNLIISNSQISNQIDFEAGKSIELLPGFYSANGSVFKAEIKTCP